MHWPHRPRRAGRRGLRLSLALRRITRSQERLRFLVWAATQCSRFRSTRSSVRTWSNLNHSFASARKAGFRKFILVGSAGSTPTGSFDNLVVLAEVARKHRAWFHVDAAHGAGLAFSRRFRWRLKGLSRTDSIIFDPHKMMFMPLAAGGVLVRDGARLLGPLQEQAPYLFGPKRRWPDLGQLTIACSQRFDALKIWLVWRVYGGELWDHLTTHVCAVTQAAFQYCSESEVLEPVHEPHSNIFCFQLRRPHDSRFGSALLDHQGKAQRKRLRLHQFHRARPPESLANRGDEPTNDGRRHSRRPAQGREDRSPDVRQNGNPLRQEDSGFLGLGRNNLAASVTAAFHNLRHDAKRVTLRRRQFSRDRMVPFRAVRGCVGSEHASSESSRPGASKLD